MVAGLLATASLLRADGMTILVADSPFAPSGVAAAAGQGAKTPPGDFELSGSTSVGGEVTVCIFERQTKKSQWIPVGGDLDGIHVVSYDSGRDTAVVTISGTRHELEMKRSVVGAIPVAGNFRSNAVTGAAPDGGPSSLQTEQNPSVAAKEQKEARMMVSDLLEIGVQQRKAYQAAKMRALPASSVPKQPGS
jgi:hypothetical protein